MNRKVALILTLLIAAVPALGGAEISPKLVGDGAVVYQVHAGAYGDLFPEANVVRPDRVVLALDITRPGKATERSLMPVSRNAAVESVPQLIHASQTDGVGVLWRSDEANGTYEVRIARYVDGEWLPAETLFSSDAGHPLIQVAFTHDTYRLAATAAPSAAMERDIVHLFQSVVGDDGLPTVVYTPLVFVQSTYVGWYESVDLALLASVIGEDLSGAVTLPDSVLGTLSVSVSDDHRAINLAFVSPRTLTLETYQLGVLPLEVAILDDLVQDLVLSSTDTEIEDLSSFAGGMGARIVPTGRQMGLDPAVIEMVTDAVGAELMASGDSYAGDRQGLADAMSDLTLQLTASLFGSPVTTRVNESNILELDVGGLLAGLESPLSKILELKAAHGRLVPYEVTGDDVHLLTSDDGQDVLIAWRRAGDSNRLWYFETVPDGWSAPLFLDLGGQLGLNEALSLLRARIH